MGHPDTSKQLEQMEQMEARLTATLKASIQRQLNQQKAELSDSFKQQLYHQSAAPDNLRQQLDALHQQVTIPFVWKTAAQCLNHALSTQRQPAEGFSTGVSGRDSAGPFRAFVKHVYGNGNHTQRAAALDAMLERGNRQHCTESMGRLADTSLGETVDRALHYISVASCVRQACQEELLILDNYKEDPGIFRPVCQRNSDLKAGK